MSGYLWREGVECVLGVLEEDVPDAAALGLEQLDEAGQARLGVGHGQQQRRQLLRRGLHHRDHTHQAGLGVQEGKENKA